MARPSMTRVNRFDRKPRRYYIMASPFLRAQVGNPDKRYKYVLRVVQTVFCVS
jgi:hypothetical protein